MLPQRSERQGRPVQSATLARRRDWANRPQVGCACAEFFSDKSAFIVQKCHCPPSQGLRVHIFLFGGLRVLNCTHSTRCGNIWPSASEGRVRARKRVHKFTCQTNEHGAVYLFVHGRSQAKRVYQQPWFPYSVVSVGQTTLELAPVV